MPSFTVDLGTVYDETLTIVNRLDAKDGGLKQDAYRKTVLHGCMWSAQSEHTVGADGTVSIGTVHRVQIPESPDYRPYREWAEDPQGFTVRLGDYVVRGEVAEGFETAAEAKRVLAAYEPDVFIVQHFRDLTKREGFIHSSDGILRFAECYYLEG